MRSSLSFLSTSLKSFDDEMRSIVSGITNTLFDANDVSWKQATLPVKDGGLGFRSAVHVAPSAYLASAESSSDLAHCILPPHFGSCPLLHYDEAITMWSQSHDQTPPVGSEVYKQKCWDAPRVSSLAKSLLDGCSNSFSHARLLAASCKESGAWLNALPISSLGLRLMMTLSVLL